MKKKIREEEALDGYYMLLTSEMETSDDEIIDMYRGYGGSKSLLR